MTKIHVLRIVLFVRHQFKCCALVYNTTVGPSGHGMKTPSPRLGTLYSCCRQWFITKIHVLRLVLFVRRQFKRWGTISNTHTGPHDSKPPSSRLGTLCSCCRQWFITKIRVLRLVLFVRRKFKHWRRFQTPHWDTVFMIRSHHRGGWGPCTATISNGLWQKSMYWG